MSTFKIISVETKPGSSFGRGWRNPMQEITTDKGVLIDNMPGKSFGGWIGHNWSNEIGCSVEANVVDNSGYNWLEFKNRL